MADHEENSETSSVSSLELSCYSSDFEVLNEHDLQPYQFEPELSDAEVEETPDRDDFSESLDRLMSTNWCQCANCAGMGSIRECRCCQEIPEMESLTVSTGVGCITDHPGFRSVCLDHYVLETCYHWYNQQYGRAIQDANERYRCVAYRMLVQWVWKWLGRDIRVTLPACAVARIREQFPSADGQYVGYRDPE
ncbi:hypothetical protein V1264_009174 [Littorina saxatilis]|uniref:P2X purinoreceptor 7 intracellular domain-containing protein n=1 Tax=Littorina saxatilis TaxID=31220 RepID=A0AAN9G129_9CAEN